MSVRREKELTAVGSSGEQSNCAWKCQRTVNKEQLKRGEKKRKGERLEGRKERVRESRQGLQVNREQL